MPFESISQPITADSPAAHEKELGKKLLEIQLGFVASKIKPSDSIDFSEALDRYTAIFDELVRRFEKKELDFALQLAERINQSSQDQNKIGEYLDAPARVPETKEMYLERLKNHIDRLYREYPERVTELVGQYITHESEALGEAPQSGRPENAVGPFRYQIKDGLGKTLGDFGIDDADECLEIHLERLYKQEDQNYSFKKIQADFENLAEVIVKNYPQTKAVVGTSWLMNSRIVRRLGFTVIDAEPADDKVGMETWSQFIDKDGQVNRQRLEKFISIGAPPVKSRTGVMTVEDFLRHYLPPHWRGKEITLKEINPAWPETGKDLQATAKKLKEKVGKLTATELKELIHGSPAIRRGLATPEGRSWYNFVSELFDKKYENWEELRRDNAARLEEIGKKFEAVLLAGKYLDKKITIR